MPLLLWAIFVKGRAAEDSLPWACLRELKLRTFRRGENNYLVVFLERTFEFSFSFTPNIIVFLLAPP